MFKWVSSLVTGVLLLLAAILCFRASRSPKQTFAELPLALVPVDGEAALQRFAGALRIQTVSEPLQSPNATAMQQLRDYLRTNFPRVHQTMSREVVR
jgi:hypothetical protein